MFFNDVLVIFILSVIIYLVYFTFSRAGVLVLHTTFVFLFSFSVSFTIVPLCRSYKENVRYIIHAEYISQSRRNPSTPRRVLRETVAMPPVIEECFLSALILILNTADTLIFEFHGR